MNNQNPDKPYSQLNRMIDEQETILKAQRVVLKESFHAAYESLRPMNVLVSTAHQLNKPEVQSGLIATGITLLSQFLIKKIAGAADRSGQE